MALQELKRFSDLSACIDELIALEPESTKSYLVKGFHVQRNLNDSQAALKWFSKAVELDPSNLKNWKTKGDALMNLRHYSKALACFNAILSMNPQNECALRSKAICCLQNGALGKALESILIAYEINPENVDTLIGRGIILGALSQYSEALETLHRAWEEDPGSSIEREINFCYKFEI
mmetsp:Transcript_2723/g.2876  ORF Transcript_2723/g.2876 Transcript_2723/m.2876 type:complete len:178 (+) Transcript_2723:1340-1873(+)